MSVSQPKGDGLVVFDTGVVEGRYLIPMLRSEPIRDFARLKTSGFKPAITFKSICEILQHAKQGRNSRRRKLPWMVRDIGYPGGIADYTVKTDDGKESRNGERYWAFAVAGEWVDDYWDWMLRRIGEHLEPSDVSSALSILEHQKGFVSWRDKLIGFCKRIHEVIEAEMTILYPTTDNIRKINSLMLKWSYSALVPNEDLEIIACAVASGAEAFVASEKYILGQTYLSFGLNSSFRIIHPSSLYDLLGHAGSV